jgi:hypothetical protein
MLMKYMRWLGCETCNASGSGGLPDMNQMGTVLAVREDGLGFDLYEPGGIE